MLRIVYNGIERADFIYYLTVILATKSNKVIVNDSSKSKDLFNAVSSNSKEKMIEWKNVIFTQNLDESKTDFDENDIFIDYRGLNAEPKSVGNLEETYHLIMPDYTEAGLAFAKALSTEGEAVYILRDACTRKVTDKSFEIECGLKKDALAGHIELSMEDMAAYVALTYNGKQKFNKCSKDMIMALTYVTGLVLSIKKEKDALKVIQQANKLIA